MSFVKVQSPNVRYTDEHIFSDYVYQCSKLRRDGDQLVVEPQEVKYSFRTTVKPTEKLGLMLVGWGGNNGSTLTAGLLANRLKLEWQTKEGVQKADWLGSLTQSATVRLGAGSNEVVGFNRLLPMVDPDQVVVGGWDISGVSLAEAVDRAGVLEPDLRRQLRPMLAEMRPLPSVYYPDFIAGNQADRADNLIEGESKSAHLQRIRDDIRQFKTRHQLQRLVVIWTANTERYCQLLPGVNDTADALLRAIELNHPEVSPSTLFAVAAILEDSPFINGSPQNTLVDGCLELAQQRQTLVAGDDFKTGQTKLKSVLVDFLVGAGIKPVSIVSYNHLGNNDGRNLSAPQQFRSKEISKSSVVDDMVAGNPLLYAEGEKPDHVVVIKYVPAVGDSKRALDEYYSRIFLGGRSTIAIHNTCEDSLLAAPLILDLAILTELFTRIAYKTGTMPNYVSFHSVLSLLSYLLKAPVVPSGEPVVNALFRQRHALENVLRACAGLPPQNDMLLETKAPDDSNYSKAALRRDSELA